MTTIWVYDYLLTVGDEVGVHPDGDDDAVRNLTTLYRSVTCGKLRVLSVRESVLYA